MVAQNMHQSILPEAHLQRIKTSDQGTIGFLTIHQTSFAIIELPWKNNEPNFSCIPEGSYSVVVRRSSKYGVTYWLQNVVDRSWILIHSGNYAGDVFKHYKTHSAGCLLIGTTHGILNGQVAVLASRIAFVKFMQLAKGMAFKLNVRSVV